MAFEAFRQKGIPGLLEYFRTNTELRLKNEYDAAEMGLLKKLAPYWRKHLSEGKKHNQLSLYKEPNVFSNGKYISCICSPNGMKIIYTDTFEDYAYWTYDHQEIRTVQVSFNENPSVITDFGIVKNSHVVYNNPEKAALPYETFFHNPNQILKEKTATLRLLNELIPQLV
jgi:hypothetical protein